jgi:hypothetical protein
LNLLDFSAPIRHTLRVVARDMGCGAFSFGRPNGTGGNADGGGISNDAAGNVTVTSSSIDENFADRGGSPGTGTGVDSLGRLNAVFTAIAGILASMSHNDIFP